MQNALALTPFIIARTFLSALAAASLVAFATRTVAVAFTLAFVLALTLAAALSLFLFHYVLLGYGLEILLTHMCCRVL